MNIIKKSLVRGTKDRVGTSKEVGVLLLLASHLITRPWGLISSSCSLVRSAKKLLQEFCQALNLKVIAIEI